jgi:hypothetical protein
VRRWLSLVLIAAIAIAACTPIDPEGFDWCHIYNLNEPMSNLFIDHGGQETLLMGGIYGEYVGDGNYLYQFEIIEPFNVYPAAMEITYTRAFEGNLQTVQPRLPQGTAFGHDISPIYQTGLLMDQQIASYPFEIDYNEENPVGDDRITAQFSTYGDMYVNQIAVYGYGVSPYGYTECGDTAATNTPIDQPPTETVIPTATNTPVPSITNTPTQTFTPSATPMEACEFDWDFSATSGGWSATNYPGQPGTWGSYSGGWNGTFEPMSPSTAWLGALTIERAMPVDMIITNVEVTISKTNGTFSGTMNEVFYVNGVSKRSTNSMGLNGSYGFGVSGGSVLAGQMIKYGNTYHKDISSPFNDSGSLVLTYLKIIGTCPSPTPTPTMTFTPSLTPTPTDTNTPSIITNTPGTPTRTPVPSATRTLTPSPLPPIASPTAFTPFPTWTLENTLPVPTELPTRTLIPHSTALGTVTAEATFPVPGFGTGAPDITAVSTAPALGTLAGVDGHSDIYNLLSTAVVEVNDLPGDLTGYVPDPDITPMIGYAKWFLSCSSLYEILGENVGTMACHAAVGVTLIVILSSVFIALKIITLVMKFAIWIFHQIRDIIPLV